MNKLEPFLLALVFAYAGMRIYQKYFKKNGNASAGKKQTPGKDKLSDDSDYEPYSGK